MPELGEGDEEQDEELLPVTNTDDVSLLGQTPQSTDVPLPPPPPSRSFRPPLTPILIQLYCFVAVVVLAGFLWFGWDDWIDSDLPVWAKVIFALLAVPFGVALWYWLLCVW